MRGFDHATIFSSSFHGVRKERLAQWPAFCVPNTTKKPGGGYFQKNWVGVCNTLLETLPLFQTKIWDFPYPISVLKPWRTLETVACPERVTSCYGTYTVVGVNIKKEIVLSPNDEEVGNCSKKHTQFKTRVHKPYPISDQNGGNWYPISDQNGWKTTPFGAAHTHVAYIRDYAPGRKTRCGKCWERSRCKDVCFGAPPFGVLFIAIRCLQKGKVDPNLLRRTPFRPRRKKVKKPIVLRAQAKERTRY